MLRTLYDLFDMVMHEYYDLVRQVSFWYQHQYDYTAAPALSRACSNHPVLKWSCSSRKPQFKIEGTRGVHRTIVLFELATLSPSRWHCATWAEKPNADQ
jgi:hypothetical protein